MQAGKRYQQAYRLAVGPKSRSVSDPKCRTTPLDGKPVRVGSHFRSTSCPDRTSKELQRITPNKIKTNYSNRPLLLMTRVNFQKSGVLFSYLKCLIPPFKPITASGNKITTNRRDQTILTLQQRNNQFFPEV